MDSSTSTILSYKFHGHVIFKYYGNLTLNYLFKKL